MSVKPLIVLVTLSLALSACSLLGTDTEEVVTVSQKPALTKASTKPAADKKCSDEGFCALPGLKKFQKAE